MLHGLYGYIFGAEDSNDSNDSQASNDSETSLGPAGKVTEDDWCLVDDAPSGRSSPELIPNLELRDIDQLSFASKKAKNSQPLLNGSMVVTWNRPETIWRLFADVDAPGNPVSLTSLKAKTSLVSAGKLKRATAATHVNSEAKTKTRSKKVGKMSSGRNNDRKVNNIE
ncbi:hypothetical protein GCK32_001480 [Trichostrongylus colubriformis]|uniref:Uncharacterized protein n=1 Tax=Trichostrongylus colubriformis TaxID=6319 RepID=A0AAN8FH18_TRICO